MSSLLSIMEIKELLPHRYPFLLVDAVESLAPGESIVALKNVTVNEPFFNGHFPEMPVMPGVLMVEALAQASGILTLRTLEAVHEPGSLFLLASINQAKFKSMVVPGDQLKLHVEVLVQKKKVWKFRGVAMVGDRVACEAEFMNIKG